MRLSSAEIEKILDLILICCRRDCFREGRVRTRERDREGKKKTSQVGFSITIIMLCSAISSCQFPGRLISSRHRSGSSIRLSEPFSPACRAPAAASYLLPSRAALRTSALKNRLASKRERVSKRASRIIPKASLFGRSCF